ncbi:ThiF family adenylyltransferase, partial [Saccharothrix longispora]|uniref:ThiF family adenylyltransferase n=1 Tax=Saccharothrix longispora TaxID=33920 RepID=UPI0028FD03B9
MNAALPDDFAVSGRPTLHWSGYLLVPIRLRTASLVHHPGGLRLDDHEDFVLWIGQTDFFPPVVEVQHDRFVGFPHVLHGRQLCIYLDVAREWNPRLGASSVVDRLYDWLKDATANRFDPDTSLFHAVGGVPYGSRRLPAVVVRDDCPTVRAQSGYLVKRTDHRLDLHFARTQFDEVQIPVVGLTMPLPLGIGHTFIEVLARLDDPFADAWLDTHPKHPPQSPVFLTSLAASASRMPEGSPQMFALTVPHPAGGPPHLLVGMIPGEAADRLRRHVRNRRTSLISVSTRTFDPETPVEWCPVSDERVSVTTRRDSARPVNAFHGKTVHVWGCGGLGSWIAEFLARAGAKRLVLCDPGTITGGLLVRQNFTELDLGNGKAEALRERILAIRDDIEVDAHSGIIPQDLPATFPAAHVVIDATVS